MIKIDKSSNYFSALPENHTKVVDFWNYSSARISPILILIISAACRSLAINTFFALSLSLSLSLSQVFKQYFYFYFSLPLSFPEVLIVLFNI